MSWETATAVLSRGIEAGAAPGAVAVLGDRDGIVHQAAIGYRDVPEASPMAPDAIFRIASQTKQVNAIAVLQLIERGLLDLELPVGDVLPDFDEVQVIDGWDGETPRLREPRRRATIRELMTHTSGLTYDVLHPAARRYLLATGVPMPSSGLLSCFRSPMVAEPGTEWNYGMSADWTGRVVEAVSGERLDVYYRRNIFEPLGLEDIGFDLSPRQRERLAPAYRRNADGSWTDLGFEWVSTPEFLSAGHGLYATARDYFAIQLLLLRGGEARGVRLLTEASVRTMMSDQLRGVPVHTMPSTVPDFSADMVMDPGTTWGLDIMLTAKRVPGMREVGSAGWAGTFNTFFWVDPASNLAGALYLQTLPFFAAPALGLAGDFERAVYLE